MKLFHRKSPWERALDKVPGSRAVGTGALAAAGVIGLSAASAVVSAIRTKDRQR